jgi:cysteine-rich repeat protein
MLSACPACPGLVPEALDACPHCGASTKKSSVAGKAKALAALAGGGAMMMSLMACYGYVDDGYYDYTDGSTACSSDAQCPVGQTCDEWSGVCTSDSTTSTGTVKESDCSDEVDDDADGLVDCDDPDCELSLTCDPQEICANGADDDQDGYLDCEDSDCPPCPSAESFCGNLVDDDLDGLVDCADPDCAAECTPAVCGDGALNGGEQCDDGGTTDGDGCSAACAIELDVFCSTLPPLVLGDSAGDTTNGTNGFAGTCVPAGGREVAYTFTAIADGALWAVVE